MIELEKLEGGVQHRVEIYDLCVQVGEEELYVLMELNYYGKLIEVGIVGVEH